MLEQKSCLRVLWFYSLQNVGIEKGDIPDLTKAPSSLLEALEGHLASVEGRKGSTANTPTQSSRSVQRLNFALQLIGNNSFLKSVQGC